MLMKSLNEPQLVWLHFSVNVYVDLQGYFPVIHYHWNVTILQCLRDSLTGMSRVQVIKYHKIYFCIQVSKLLLGIMVLEKMLEKMPTYFNNQGQGYIVKNSLWINDKDRGREQESGVVERRAEISQLICSLLHHLFFPSPCHSSVPLPAPTTLVLSQPPRQSGQRNHNAVIKLWSSEGPGK